MSMVKSAVRTSVSKRESLVDLMGHLNEALFHLREHNAYVTLACLRSGLRAEWNIRWRVTHRSFTITRHQKHFSVEDGTTAHRDVFLRRIIKAAVLTCCPVTCSLL